MKKLLIWEIPQTLLALLLMLFRKKDKKIFKDTIVYKYNLMGGISLGRFIFLSERLYDDEFIIMHEYGHTLQSKKLGPLYFIVIGIPSIFHAITYNKKSGKDYYSFWTEKWANKLAKIK
jgi:hypothetical protein